MGVGGCVCVCVWVGVGGCGWVWVGVCVCVFCDFKIRIHLASEDCVAELDAEMCCN